MKTARVRPQAACAARSRHSHSQADVTPARHCALPARRLGDAAARASRSRGSKPVRPASLSQETADSSIPDQSLPELGALLVKDVMTTPAFSLPPETSVQGAMAFLVAKKVSGVPVTDPAGRVLGVCSGYDLLALDSTPGKLDKSFFPPIDTCIKEFGGDRKLMWSNFKQLRQKLTAAQGSTVREVMHRAFVISPEDTMETAANMVVQKRAHRICVVDKDNMLLGVVSRGDIMRATVNNFKFYMSLEDCSRESASK